MAANLRPFPFSVRPLPFLSFPLSLPSFLPSFLSSFPLSPFFPFSLFLPPPPSLSECVPRFFRGFPLPSLLFPLIFVKNRENFRLCLKIFPEKFCRFGKSAYLCIRFRPKSLGVGIRDKSSLKELHGTRQK